VKTNLSKNAILGNGELLGKMDDNIKKGIPVEEACDDIMKAIFLKRYWVTLGSLYYQIGPKLSVLSESFTYYLGVSKYQSQMDTFERAKKS
jgi:hypothetical protein